MPVSPMDRARRADRRPDGAWTRPRRAADGRPLRAPPPAAPAIPFGPRIYLVHTQPGFESIAWSEIAARYADAALPDQAKAVSPGGREEPPRAEKRREGIPRNERGREEARRRDNRRGGGRQGDLTRGGATREIARRTVPDRVGISIFTAPRPDLLSHVRSAEDIFTLAGYRHAGVGRPLDLDHVRAAAREAPYVEAALTALVRMLPGRRGGHRLRFRVVARMVGEREFRRVDLQRAVERGVLERGDHSWRLVDDNADVEIWATMFPDDIFLAIRLSDERMRHRDYKVAHMPGSLRPAVAAALGWLSQPAEDDVVLDPLCGAGTILIERAQIGRYKLLMGSDHDSEALAAARTNVGPRYKPLELHPWDAAAIPLPDASVDKVITNLPWGIRHGSHDQNRRAYPRIISEIRRVVRPDGLIVMLTGETRLMSDVLRRCRLRPSKTFRVSILGAMAGIYVCPAS
jgi:tRNA (guanine6-N2)-methyltransferase